MQTEDVKAFKNRLRNYTYLLSRTVTLNNSIEFLYDRLGGVRGIDPSKEPLHTMPNKDLEWKTRDDISRLEAELSHVEDEIRMIDQILGRMEINICTAIKMVYIRGRQVKYVADRYHLSSSGLAKRMDRAIEKAIK